MGLVSLQALGEATEYGHGAGGRAGGNPVPHNHDNFLMVSVWGVRFYIFLTVKSTVLPCLSPRGMAHSNTRDLRSECVWLSSPAGELFVPLLSLLVSERRTVMPEGSRQ